MLYIKANEEKRLAFETDIQGVDCNNLKGYVRFSIYGAEYGFPVEIDNKKITAVIPPLIEIVKRDIEDGSVVEAKLELFTEKHYFSPWSGEVKVGAPMDVRAKLKEDVKGVGISTKLLTDSKEELKKVAVKEPEEKFDKNMIIAELLSEIRKELSFARKKKRQETPIITEKKTSNKITKESLKNITEDGIRKYISQAGTKNPRIQEIILDQARAAAGSSDNFKVLTEVVKIMKRKRM